MPWEKATILKHVDCHKEEYAIYHMRGISSKNGDINFKNNLSASFFYVTTQDT